MFSEKHERVIDLIPELPYYSSGPVKPYPAVSCISEQKS